MKPRLSEKTLPNWMETYKTKKLNTNATEFRFYASRSESAQPVTLFLPQDGNTSQPSIQMYFNIQKLNSVKKGGEPDDSPLKDFTNLQG